MKKRVMDKYSNSDKTYWVKKSISELRTGDIVRIYDRNDKPIKTHAGSLFFKVDNATNVDDTRNPVM